MSRVWFRVFEKLVASAVVLNTKLPLAVELKLIVGNRDRAPVLVIMRRHGCARRRRRCGTGEYVLVRS